MDSANNSDSVGSQSYITRGKLNPVKEDNEKRCRKDSFRRVSSILKKKESHRTLEELCTLEKYKDITKQISKRKELLQIYKERVVEKEDPIEDIKRKAKKLSEIISKAKHLVCYTGAGISTSARIPDYRGSNGIWTLLQQGKDIEQYDLSLAEPTYTHMALYELHRRKMLRFVVSQNCDGLHLRAGLPKNALSEIHGNMYIEVCKSCKPNMEYWRLFDTTEMTARYSHTTNRRCHICGNPLSDTIVHFGERGNLKWPLNWSGACQHSEMADVILCLGSSLKVLKKYTWLWQMDRNSKKRAKICIINLQWTPKDRISTVKINGKCDEVMRLLMGYLNIKVPLYSKKSDPIFAHSSLLRTEEFHTVTQPMLKTYNESEYELEYLQKQKPSKGPLIRLPLKNRKCLKTNLGTKKCIDLQKPNSDSNDNEFSSSKSLIKNNVFENESQDDEEVFDDNDEDISSSICESNEQNRNISNVSFNEENKSMLKQMTEPNVSSGNSLETNNELLLSGDLKTRYPSSTDTITTNKSQLSIENDSNNCYKENISLPLNECTKDGDTAIKLELNDTCNKTAQSLIDELSIKVEKNLKGLKSENFLMNAIKNEIEADIKNISVSFAIDQEVKTEQHQNGVKIFNPDKKIIIDIAAVERLISKEDRLQMVNEANCNILEGKLPNWYEVRYAYSGLHSIVQPPPPEIDIWCSQLVPLFRMNRKDAECEFCFDNYAEFKCLFYKKYSTDFKIQKYRNNKLIVCECCYYTEDEGLNECDTTDHQNNEDGSGNSNDTDTDPNSANSNQVPNHQPQAQKRVKIDVLSCNKKPIQAGWYGKGYKKGYKRKVRSRN